MCHLRRGLRVLSKWLASFKLTILVSLNIQSLLQLWQCARFQCHVNVWHSTSFSANYTFTIYSDTHHWWDITPIFDHLLIWTLLPNLNFYLIVWGFHRTFATGAACKQGMLTPPDTWSCPTLGLACVRMSRPISPELVSRLLSFEHPSVLLFCLWTSGIRSVSGPKSYCEYLAFYQSPGLSHIVNIWHSISLQA